MSNQPLFVFIHMTKTAGGTLRYALEDLRRQDIIISNLVDEAEALSESTLNKTKLLFGHLRYGLNLQTQRPIKYITFVRHPISRVISHYNQLLTVDDSRIGKKIQKFPNINDFFRESEHWEFSNFMTKIITNTADDEISDIERFEYAKEVLERDFEFVGVQELFDLSLFSLSHALNIEIQIAKNYNLGVWKMKEVNRLTFDIIIKSNQADLMLYQHAVEEQLKAHKTLNGLIHGTI